MSMLVIKVMVMQMIVMLLMMMMNNYDLMILIQCSDNISDLSIAGNLLVLYIIIRNARLRTRTNFFLANLAVADFCVGVFCVFPNLSMYISPIWHFGRVMCKIYYFAHYMSLTVPVLLLTVISMERYVAILHPLKAKQLFTFRRFRIVQILIWLLMVAYNSPQLIDYDTFTIGSYTYCYMRSERIQTNVYVLANLIIWYVIPLVVLTFMYIKIAAALWRSSSSSLNVALNTKSGSSIKYNTNISTSDPGNMIHYTSTTTTLVLKENSIKEMDAEVIQLNRNVKDMMKHHSFRQSSLPISEAQTEQESISDYESQIENERNMIYTRTPQSFTERSKQSKTTIHKNRNNSQNFSFKKSSSTCSNTSQCDSPYSERDVQIHYPRISTHKVIEARKKVIILLIMIICSFAVLALPYHIRSCLYLWIDTTSLGSLLSPICYLLYYANSGLNPLLYALLSENFRRSFRDSFSCRRKR
eukprot:XP_014780120.1 PREDICTED: galanin receptor type 1-like [Octopus bimaculoides]